MKNSYCQHILQTELGKRKERNKFYSLRAFARDLNIGSTTLSDVLAMKRQLSKANISKVSEHLSLSPQEVQRLHSERLGKKNEVLLKDLERLELEEKEFRLISEWYYMAILNLAKLPDNQDHPLWVAKRLGIKEEQAQYAMSTLKEMKLIVTEKGKICRTSCPISTSRDIPSRAIRKYHTDNLFKAQEILNEPLIPIDLREFSSTTMLVDPEQLTKAKELLMTTKRKVAKILEAGTPSMVYTLSFQLFPLETQEQVKESI